MQKNRMLIKYKKVEIMDYIATWKKRIEHDEEKRLARLKDARNAASRAALILADEFGAEGVYLFGSLVTEEDFSFHSDIDMAVTGLVVDRYFKALSRIWEVLPKGVELDLVPLEDADEYLKSKILKTGIALYEKHPCNS